MRFAQIGNERVEAKPDLKGLCPGCSKPVIAKCGTQRIHHWAHRNNKTCDRWWEPETGWHRTWKNNFPAEWQERFLPDERTGEKHVADVRTPHGLVTEFQHSSINPQERAARENFYINMVWVVDGTRLKGDYPRFLKGKIRKTTTNGIYLVESPDKCFPSAWRESSVPVIFDFKGTEVIDLKDVRNSIYCLFPIRMIERREAVLMTMSRENFVKSISDGQWLLWVRNFMGNNQQKLQNQNANPPTKSNIVIRRTEPTHYFNPRTGRYVKRRRF